MPKVSRATGSPAKKNCSGPFFAAAIFLIWSAISLPFAPFSMGT